MNPKLVLWLTKQPVRSPDGAPNCGMRLTCWILEGLTIKEELTAEDGTPLDRFTTGAINWAKQRLEPTKRTIEFVAGDAAVQATVEQAGMKYRAIANLHEI